MGPARVGGELVAACGMCRRYGSASTQNTDIVLYSRRLALTHQIFPLCPFWDRAPRPPFAAATCPPRANVFQRARARVLPTRTLALLCSGSPRHLRPPQQPRPSARGRVCRLEAAHRALARAADAPHASPSARAAHHREAHHAADCAKAPLSHHHTAASLSRPRFPRTGSRDALIARQSAAANGAAAPPRAPARDPAAAISAS